jgi:hypothetical protein
MTKVVWWMLLAVLPACGKSESSDDDDGPGAGGVRTSGGRSGAGTGGAASGAAPTNGGEANGGEANGGEANGGEASGGEASGDLTVKYFAPGTRLKPEVIALEPGLDVISSLSGGWIDTELGFSCQFLEADDRVTRCLPPPAAVVYANPACTEPRVLEIVPRSCASEAPTFVTSAPYDDDDCTRRRKGFRVVGETPFPAELYAQFASGCEPIQRNMAWDTLYELEPVPPETFVATSLAHRPRASGLDAYVREAEDGSWQALMLFDPSRGSQCVQSTAHSQLANRCVPQTAAILGFTDAACTTGAVPTASVNTCFGLPSLLGRSTLDESTCPPTITTHLFEIGETREVALDYAPSGDLCLQIPSESSEAFLQGAPVDPSDLPEVEFFELGSGAVRARFDGFAGEPYVLAGSGRSLVDAQTGLECDPLTFADGSLRCVPNSFEQTSGQQHFYTDADCAGVSVYAWLRSLPCLDERAPPVGVVIGESDATCGGYAITDVRPVVGEVAPAELYEYDDQSATCQPVTPEIGYRYLQLGDSVNSSELFPELTLELRE